MPKTEQSKEVTVPAMLNSSYGMDQIRHALPSQLSPERFARAALTNWKNSAELQKCDPRSFMSALVQIAELGLEPSPIAGQAYLVPFKQECSVIIGYKGLITLAHRSPDVLMVEGHAVRKLDHFEFSYGSEGHLVHRPKIDDLPEEWGEREDIRAFWAGVKMRNGAYKFEVMAARDVWDIEKRYSKSKREDRPWTTSPAQQGIKTVIRRLLKQVPLTVETAQAIAIDEASERGKPLPIGKAEVIEMDSVISSAQRAELEALVTDPEKATTMSDWLGKQGLNTLSEIPVSRFEEAKAACK